MTQTGAAGLSRRVGVTPIIAAVNGLAIGGGFEIVCNWFVPMPVVEVETNKCDSSDLVVASEKAQLGLPEVKRGLCASDVAAKSGGGILTRAEPSRCLSGRFEQTHT